jgi:hypothetical protein
MDTFNLDRVEILKGPASLMSGEGAAGGAVNFVNKQPHTGQIINEAFFAYDSFNGFRTGFGSGGSTAIKGLDYRFDISRSSLNGFVDDVNTKTLDTDPAQLSRQRQLQVWRVEYKGQRQRLLGHAAGVGDRRASCRRVGSFRDHTNHSITAVPPSGHYRQPHPDHQLQRPRQHQPGRGLWLRGGFEWMIAPNLSSSRLFLRCRLRVEERGELCIHWGARKLAAFSALLRRARPAPVRQHDRPHLGYQYQRHGQPCRICGRREPARVRPPRHGEVPRP